MRQSDGSEILGPNDPRNLVIGIIHVSSSDDRQSVVNAITSQDHLGRDQIVLVLPAQNKSFKDTVDFEGLRQMADELEATLVLVIPKKSKLANLARKEHFIIYATLGELASAEFPPLESDGTPASTSGSGADEAMAGTMTFPLELPDTPAPPPTTVAPQDAQPAPPNPILFPQAEIAPVRPARPISPVTPQGAVPLKRASRSSPDEAVPPASTAGPSEAAQEEEETPTSPSLPIPPDLQTNPPTGNLPAVVPPNASAVVPSNSQLPVYYEPIELPRRRSWKGLIITGITLVVLIGLGILFYRPILDLFFPPGATVTITPRSQQLQRTYQITAVLGVPDPTKNQVDARALYADSQTQERTVKATGKGHIAGQQAHGVLTFYNTSTSAQTVAAGSIVFDPNGLAVVNEQTVVLPALDTTTGLNGVSVLAHTVNAGIAQNIPAYDFNSQPCCNGAVYVTNAQPFTGGQDQQTFTYVQQSDIDSVVQSLSATQARQATTTLQSQVHSTEKPAGTPRCAPQVKSDHQAGEQADTVIVSVTTSCIGEVYDMQAVQVLVARKLGQEAATNPGPTYAQVGDILVQVSQATPDAHSNILLVTNAGGIWVYQFTNAQRSHLASLIAGKSKQDAHSILLGQTGVQAATITLTGINVAVVPGSVSRITLNIEEVQGLHP